LYASSIPPAFRKPSKKKAPKLAYLVHCEDAIAEEMITIQTQPSCENGVQP